MRREEVTSELSSFTCRSNLEKISRENFFMKKFESDEPMNYVYKIGEHESELKEVSIANDSKKVSRTFSGHVARKLSTKRNCG